MSSFPSLQGNPLSLNPMYNPLVRIMQGMSPTMGGPSSGLGGPLAPQSAPRAGNSGASIQPVRPYTGVGSQPPDYSKGLGDTTSLMTSLKGLQGLFGGGAAASPLLPDMSSAALMDMLGPGASFTAPGTGLSMGAIGGGPTAYTGGLGIDTGIASFIPTTPIWDAGVAAGTGAVGAGAAGGALDAGALIGADAAATGAAGAGAAAAGTAAAEAGGAAAAEGGADWLLALLAFL